jgi:tetratricopeptide (TPR) repeat protein
MKRILMISTVILLACPALAEVNFIQSPAYKECTALAASNPSAALAKADEWLKIDNSIPAQHCHAMALYGLRRFAEAGEALNNVRMAIPNENLPMRVYVTHQAIRAWMSAERADAALATINAQINDMSSVRGDNAVAAKLTAGLLLERARLNVTYGKLTEAVKDLDRAVSLTPLNEEVLLERAGVFEQLGDVPLARADTQAVLTLNNANTKARALLRELDAKAPKAAGQE